MGISDSNTTNGRDELIIVIGDGYNDGCGQSADAYHTQVTENLELRVVTRDKYSSTRVFKGIPQHFNGTVGTVAITITPTIKTTAVIIRNPQTNGANDLLQVSFDGGANYFDIERRGQLEIETEITSFKLKASSANRDYQIIVTEYNP